MRDGSSISPLRDYGRIGLIQEGEMAEQTVNATAKNYTILPADNNDDVKAEAVIFSL